MTADEIKALVKRLRKHSETGTCFEGTMRLANNAANALDGLTQDIEDLKHDNASMLDSLNKESTARCEAEDDAERYRWLSGRFIGADFEWNADEDGKGGIPVLCIRMPDGGVVFGDLTATVDAARSQSEEKP